jgi:hypothetical protein
MRNSAGEGDRVASLYQLRAEPITLTLVRYAPSTSPAGEVVTRGQG